MPASGKPCDCMTCHKQPCTDIKNHSNAQKQHACISELQLLGCNRVGVPNGRVLHDTAGPFPSILPQPAFQPAALPGRQRSAAHPLTAQCRLASEWCCADSTHARAVFQAPPAAVCQQQSSCMPHAGTAAAGLVHQACKGINGW